MLNACISYDLTTLHMHCLVKPIANDLLQVKSVKDDLKDKAIAQVLDLRCMAAARDAFAYELLR